MSLYAAYVLAGTDGSVQRVFLVKKSAPDAPAFDIEKLSELRDFALTKYSQDLKAIDLEVIAVDQLKDRIKQINGSVLRRRKR